MTTRELLARLRDWMRRDRLDVELSEELRFHREALARDARATGTADDEAAWAAARQLGNVTRVMEESRDRWSLPWLDHLQQDVRYALRGLRRSPAFTTTVVLTLGLGIGANAAMFGVIDRLMFRPPAYLRDPGEVHRVYLQTTGRERVNTNVEFPYARYLDFVKWTSSFAETTPFLEARHGVGIGDAARVRKVIGAGDAYFTFFDVRPVLGRFFLPDETAIPTGANVAVLSHAFWTELGQRDVIGEPLQVGDVAYTIVGVAPDGFIGVSHGMEPAVWVPITAYAFNEGGGSRHDYFERYNWDWTQMLVRLKPGVDADDAEADLTRAFVRSRQAARVVHPTYAQVERANPRAILGSEKIMAGPAPGLESRTLLWVTGVSGIVLLIACANVTNLLLARALRRRRETAVRVALGVGRGRLATQSVTESLVLALIGCGLGLLIAHWGGSAIQRLFVPYSTDTAVDWRTLTFAAVTAGFAGVLTGLAPLLFAHRLEPASTLKSGSREGTFQRSRLRSALLVMQGALSVVLLVGAALFVRSLSRAGAVQLGYDVDPIGMIYLENRGARVEPTENVALRARVLDAVRALPEVEGATWTSNTPRHGTSTTGLAVPGIDSVAALGRFTYQSVGPGYFDVIGTRILRGRAITEIDRAGAPRVAVVSEAMARTLWPGRDALGQCMRVGFFPAKADTMPCTTVVGVAENVVNSFDLDYPFRYYLPDEQLRLGSLLLVRTRGDAVLSIERVRRTAQAVLPGLGFAFGETLADLDARSRRSWKLGAAMFVAFGVLALIVAAVGLYGVIAYTVAQRQHEMGVRMALGARPSGIARLVLGEGLRVAVAGVIAGTVLALLGARWIQPLLFRQSATDPAVFVLVSLVLLTVAAAASLLPALRAMRADPAGALRAD